MFHGIFSPASRSAPCAGRKQLFELLTGGNRIRLNPERGAYLYDRFVESSLQPVRDRKVAMGLPIPRIDRECSLKVDDRLLYPVSRAEQHREVEVCVGVVRVQRNRPSQLLDGLVHLPRRVQPVAEIEANAVVVRFEADGGGEMLRGVREASVQLQHRVRGDL